MEQEPQRELQRYTLERIAYWLRWTAYLAFIFLAAFIAVAAYISLLGT
jgi:hypothetical protein